MAAGKSDPRNRAKSNGEIPGSLLTALKPHVEVLHSLSSDLGSGISHLPSYNDADSTHFPPLGPQLEALQQQHLQQHLALPALVLALEGLALAAPLARWLASTPACLHCSGLRGTMTGWSAPPTFIRTAVLAAGAWCHQTLRGPATIGEIYSAQTSQRLGDSS